MTDLGAATRTGHGQTPSDQDIQPSVPSVPNRAHLRGHASGGSVPSAPPLKRGHGAHPDRAGEKSAPAPYMASWREKARQAVQHRWRAARLTAGPLPRVALQQQLGLDPERLFHDGLVAAAGGCPSCGGLTDLGRVRLCVVDRDAPPSYPSNLEWRTAPCPSCRTRRAA